MSETPNTLQSALPEIDPAVRRRSRIKLVSIFAIFAVPLILASIYLHLVRSSGGSMGDTSRGELIQPAVPLTQFSLQATDESFDLDAVRGLWTMLYVPVGPCLDACKQNLYHMRQVRLALNHRMNRVQRAVVMESPEQISVKAQEGMDVLEDAIYLIDPFGNLMLRFAPDLKPNAMLKDIKHLLKVSRIG